MDAINPINPNALFMIKGADQTIYTTNGGQGFVTDQQLISAAQCSNPNAFFRSLLAKSYSTQAWLCIPFCTYICTLLYKSTSEGIGITILQ